MVFESLHSYLITICSDFAYVPIVRTALTWRIVINTKTGLETTLQLKVEFSAGVMQATHRSKHRNQQEFFMHTHSFLFSSCSNTNHWQKNMSLQRCLKICSCRHRIRERPPESFVGGHKAKPPCNGHQNPTRKHLLA